MMKQKIRTACSDCGVELVIDTDAGAVVGGGRTGRAYWMDGDDFLTMWECPCCGYSDSHCEYED